MILRQAQDRGNRLRHDDWRISLGLKEPLGNSKKERLVLYALSVLLFALCSFAESQVKKLPRIGYISLASQPGQREEAFIQGLRDLGWVDGQNISIEYRWAAGDVDRRS